MIAEDHADNIYDAADDDDDDDHGFTYLLANSPGVVHSS